MQFQFPLELEELREVSGMEEVKATLARLGSQNQLDYRYMRRKGMYLYVLCKRCKSFLRFKKDQQNETYLLRSWDTTHIHSVSKNRKNESLKDFIKQLPLNVNLSTARKLAQAHLQETSSRFYYYYNKINSNRFTFSQFVAFLDAEHYEIQYEPFERDSDMLPDLLIAISPLMKQMYHKYGEVAGIDFTFKLIREKHTSGKMWKVGMVVGNSLSRKIVPFALLVALEESADSYYKLIKSFGNIMGRLPGVIVTDESKGAESAIKKLTEEGEFQGIHVLDLFHVLQNLRKKLKNKDHFHHFVRLANCKNRKNFQILVREVLDRIQIEDMPIFEKFITGSISYCFSQVQNVFFGFSTSTGSNQKIHDLIKNVLPSQKSFVFACQQILKLSQQLLQNCDNWKIEKSPVEKYFRFSELKEMRFHVDYKILSKVCDQMAETITLELQESDHQLKVIDLNSKESFTVMADQNLRYQCECQYFSKTGIMCCHIIKVCLIKKKRLMNYIHPRWLISNINDSQGTLKVDYPGRPRMTRRKRG